MQLLPPEADPPVLTGGVQRFGSHGLQGRPRGLSHTFPNGRDHDRPSSPKGVLVNEQFVLRKSDGARVLHGVPDGRAGPEPEQRPGYGAGGDHRTDERKYQ